MNGHMSQQQMITYGVIGLVVVILLAFRIMRARKPRPLKVNLLWVAPAIIAVVFGAMTALMLYAGRPIGTTAMAALAASLLGGAALGWWRGKFTHIAVDAENGSVTAQATSMGFVVLIVLLVARLGLRFLFLKDVPPQAPLSMQVNAGFMLFAIGLLCVASLEMWTRAKKLIAAAKGA
ncbi:MAG: DUF1453 family protein [Proteobacteria bacterium]|nr:DUF1453 family protein [Pseudomonadota bacterium]